jgi:myosin heavy subunit
MTLLNAALFFVFVCNLAFLTGATFLLYRIVDATERTSTDLQKAANQTVEAAHQLHSMARRTINEMSQVNETQAIRESSRGRTVAELTAQVKSLIERLHTEPARAGTVADDSPASLQAAEDIRAKLRAELNSAVARNHQLQDEIDQTTYRLKDASSSNKELQLELSEVKGIKQSVVDRLIQRTTELEAQLQQARERAKAAELHAESNAVQLDDIREKVNAQKPAGEAAGEAGPDQSGLVQSQQDQIDVLSAREKALMARIDQMEQAFQRNQTEKNFIEERFLQLDSAEVVPATNASNA